MTQGIRLFFSYSHQDEALRDELAKHGWEVRDAAGSWRLVRKLGTP